MTTIVDTKLWERFADLADCLAFLTGKTPTVEEVVGEWCDRAAQDPAVALVIDARRIARGGEAPPAPKVGKPPAKRAKDRAGEAPVGEHVCPECGFVAQALNGLGTHRARKHGVRGATLPGSGSGGDFTCPVDGCTFSTYRSQGLASHMRVHQAEPEPAAEREPFVLPVAGFDGRHRLAHERRVGRDVDAYCACGESSGVTDREDARAWLRQHIEEAAA